MLDPRFKTFPFESESCKINDGLCSKLIALKILEDEVASKAKDMGITQKPVLQHSIVERSAKKSIFDHLLAAKASAISTCAQSTKGEIDMYIELPYEDVHSNPLLFWKNNEQKFPILSNLAKIFLGFPASSGSVERLFSIAGALQRSRRSSLKWNKIETILCVRDLRLEEIFGN
ncbi:unnamed protein product [Allacma fusca]|uniref:HAT C-terminal dimerisation domain-containing protein n=1 Tax=Allacma fusca TaxID=39272 RepID=A0A8J2P0I0_9HEXA|nr:unnamed protein product [Allacma fusca]